MYALILFIMMQKTRVIIGPTASGKSAISLEYARKHSADIISADAFQVYQEFNIGTGKLSPDEMQGIPHHLIDHIHPETAYSVQMFLDDVARIQSSHEPPFIICGGSAMYLKALLYGYTPLKRLPPNERPSGSPKSLWERLHQIDPDLANKTPYQNKVRVQRYLELYMIYNQPPSELFSSQPFDQSTYQVIGLSIEKEVLKERINERVNTMIKKGLVDEVNYLMKKYDINFPAFHAIGYKEIVQYFQNKFDKDTMIDTIKKHTFQYAKRQMTWFRTFDHVEWLSQ